MHDALGRAGLNEIRDYPIQYALDKAVSTLSLLPMLMLATHPHRSFDLLFLAAPMLLTLAYAPYLTDYKRFYARVRGNSVSAIVFGIGAFLWHRRNRALEHAHELGQKDSARYVSLWDELLHQDGFGAALLELREAWHSVQAAADHSVPRWQPVNSGVGALFREADLLNDILHAKLHDVCVAHGGTFHRSDVKAEARALQKVFRTYGGDYRRLNDLCRSSLIFDSLLQMASCLRAIGDDTELCVVPSGDNKMRLRDDFNAAAESGGYRDVQLTVLFDSAEARERGVHRHLAEVQLHFAPIIALKSGGGHKSYVLRRNLRGQ